MRAIRVQRQAALQGLAVGSAAAALAGEAAAVGKYMHQKIKSKFFRLVVISGLALFFFAPAAFAATQKIIFDQRELTNSDSASAWQIFNNTDESLYLRDGGLLLHSDGDAYLVYTGQFNYQQYDRMKLTIAVNQPVRLTVIPDVSTTGFNTYELRRYIQPASQPTTVDLSLRLPFFKNSISDLGINFFSEQPAEIIISQIILEKSGPAELFAVAVKDYLRVFEYSPFTVNVFAAPRIFGHPAAAYVMPIIIVLILLMVFSKRWRRLAMVLILVIWIITDARMTYEFFSYHLADYRSYVAPVVAEKRLRTYGDFYQFADWTTAHMQPGAMINFYKSGSAHFPRLLQYLTYPLVINDEGTEAKTYLVYNRKDIVYDESSRLLYLNGVAITGAGQVTDRYNTYSFIFQEE
ncbi:MAG: hypothetical protein HUU49_00455 [Candidatus Buchananbacteria bacterium]|nr:hypothetical protein [Candidatus Buchananbacteria bacterium]